MKNYEAKTICFFVESVSIYYIYWFCEGINDNDNKMTIISKNDNINFFLSFAIFFSFLFIIVM